MRRTWGSLDPKTLQMSDLLSELYTSMGHYREAQGVHENILRLVVEGDDGDGRTLDTMTSARVLLQLEFLKQSFLRLHGWDKSPEIYTELIQDLKQMPEYRDIKEWKEVRLPTEWNPKEQASETLGKFAPPEEWDFVEGEEKGRKDGHHRRPGMGVKRATSNWGLGLVRQFLHGESDEMPKGAVNGNKYGCGYGSLNGGVKMGGGRKIDDEKGFKSAEEGTVNGNKYGCGYGSVNGSANGGGKKADDEKGFESAEENKLHIVY